MTLLSILVTLLIDHFLHGHREGRIACLVRCYAAKASRSLPASWTGVAAVLTVIVPPVIVVGLIQWALACWLFGIVYLALAIAVLLFSLGPMDVADLSEDYVEASEADDRERAAWFYQRLTGEAPPDEPAEEGRRLARTILYLVHDHLFATLFWFCVLGPAGALGYRLAAQLALAPRDDQDAAFHRSARFVLGVLGWIPARLIAFGYALTGRFDAAMKAMKGQGRTAQDWLEANRQLLGAVGTAGLRSPEPAAESARGDAGQRRSANAIAAVNNARSLAIYTGTLWLAVIAVLTLAGWFV